MQIRQSWINKIVVVVTLVLSYFVLWHRIDVNTLKLWDESRNAANAIEMLNNGQWLTRYFEGKPDMWELKPPLLIWCQVVSLKLFGFNELAIRFPSMFFSMGTIILLLWMGYKTTGKVYAGAIASIILLSCTGFIGEHAARFGDHDAMLTFFSTSLICFSYLYFETRRTMYLTLVFVSIFLGWATKSIAIFMFLPAVLLWALFIGQLKELIKKSRFWVGILFTLMLITTYYILRERTSSGYIIKVWQNEWFGRYFGISEDFIIHKDPFWYYITGFIKGRFTPYFFLLLAGIVSLIAYKKMPFRRVLFFLILNWFMFLIIISAGSKNFWYDMPLYPIAALFLGILIYQLYYLLSTKLIRIVYGIIFSMLLLSTYANSVNYILTPKKDGTESWEKLEDFLNDESNLKHGNIKIYTLGFNAPLYLYIENAKTKGVTMKIERLGIFEKGDIVIISDPQLISNLERMYNSIYIESSYNCQVRKVIGPKLQAAD